MTASVSNGAVSRLSKTAGFRRYAYSSRTRTRGVINDGVESIGVDNHPEKKYQSTLCLIKIDYRCTVGLTVGLTCVYQYRGEINAVRITSQYAVNRVAIKVQAFNFWWSCPRWSRAYLYSLNESSGLLSGETSGDPRTDHGLVACF